MSTATTGNFVDGGEVVDPFKGRAPMTLTEQAAAEEAKRVRLQEEQRAADRLTASRNETGGYNTQRGQDYQDSVASSNRRVEESRAALGFDPHKGNQRGFLSNLAHDPVTAGILLSPLAVTGAGLAVGGAGALGAGLGSGSIAAEGGSAALPAITTGGAVTEASIAAPTAAGAATGGGGAAAGGAAAAGGVTLGSALHDAAMIGGIVAPTAIHELTKGETPEEQRLLAKQEQLAQEAKARQGQQQEAHMNALGQQLLAFNPRNQMMASMFGPEAAFAPTDFAAMVQNPIPPPQLPPELAALQGKNTPNTPEQEAAYRAFIEEQNRYNQGNQQRTDMMINGIQQPGPGPTPLQPRTPQPARKY